MNFAKFKTLEDVESFLQSRIPLRSNMYNAGFGLKRAKYFLKLLGNPQNKIKVIHIAGTSGKGSTATLVSQMLESQGFKVGLHLSPHIMDIRERFQINNRFPDEKIAVKYFNKILPAIKQAENSRYGAPTYFEIIVGLAFFMFFEEGLDYAVMETGLGGLYDATNCVSNKNKIVILTKIGFDHMRILGKNISQIAFQKASIIHPRNYVISIRQYPSAQKVIKKIVDQNNSRIQWILPNRDFILRDQSPAGIVLDIKLEKFFKKIELSLGGSHQAENCTLAFACLLLCAKRDKFLINEDSLRQALRNLAIIGRMQKINLDGKMIILDGAHNPQKMASFIKSLIYVYPKQKFYFLLAFKKDKEYKKMLKIIMPIASKIILTNFTSDQENYPEAIDPAEAAEFLKANNFKNFLIINNSPENILRVISECKNKLVITGSFYLLASIYPYLKKIN